MPPKKDDKKAVKIEYSEVNVCWKRDKEAAAAANASDQVDEDTKKVMILQITELQNRTEGFVMSMLRYNIMIRLCIIY